MSETLIGQTLPQLVLSSTEGDIKLPDDLQGQWTILYFYPQDDTPGCTAEACAFRDDIDAFANLGAKVIGVSLDDLESHELFRKKYQLNFSLISDPERRLAQALGADRAGKSFSRDTFLVDERGVIRSVWRKVSPASTVNEVRTQLAELKRMA